MLPRVLVEKISAFALAKQIGLIGMWQKIYLKIELLIHLKPLPDLDLPAPQKHRSEPPKDASSTAQLGFLIVDLHLAAEREKISVKCPKKIIYHKRSQDQFLGGQFFLH